MIFQDVGMIESTNRFFRKMPQSERVVPGSDSPLMLAKGDADAQATVRSRGRAGRPRPGSGGETPNTVILARNQVGQATRSKIQTSLYDLNFDEEASKFKSPGSQVLGWVTEQ
jgi:hypothetical protein